MLVLDAKLNEQNKLVWDIHTRDEAVHIRFHGGTVDYMVETSGNTRATYDNGKGRLMIRPAKDDSGDLTVNFFAIDGGDVSFILRDVTVMVRMPGKPREEIKNFLKQ